MAKPINLKLLKRKCNDFADFVTMNQESAYSVWQALKQAEEKVMSVIEEKRRTYKVFGENNVEDCLMELHQYTHFNVPI